MSQVDGSRFSGLEQSIALAIDHGHYPGAQFYVSLAGRVLVDRSFGLASPHQRMENDHLCLWMSAGKPLTAVAVAQLVERGELDLDDPVCRYIPSFASEGKEGITTRHLLQHTAGLRRADMGWKGGEWSRTIRFICEVRPEPNWIPGEKAGYHIDGSWYLLGELVRVVDGRPIDLYLRQEVFRPIGMHQSWMGVPISAQKELGGRIAEMTLIHPSESREPPPFNRPEKIALVRPGGNIRGPFRELGWFYESLLGFRKPVLEERTVDRFTRRSRVGLLDASFRHTMDWSLGFVPDNRRYGPETVPYGYGRHASSSAFGHGGSRSSIAFADPQFGLVMVLGFNGLPTELEHQSRMRDWVSMLYEELGFSGRQDV